MQSYNMLPAHEIHALVSYIIHLSIRGEVEEELLKKAAPNEEKRQLDFRPEAFREGGDRRSAISIEG